MHFSECEKRILRLPRDADHVSRVDVDATSVEGLVVAAHLRRHARLSPQKLEEGVALAELLACKMSIVSSQILFSKPINESFSSEQTL